jgi:hypothetical protein
VAVSDKPWGGISQADYADAGSYCDSSLINLNTGPRSGWTKGDCKLQVRELGGAINRNGAHAAAAALAGARGGVDAPSAAKQAAARKLVAIYHNDLKEDPPASVLSVAG